MKAFHFTPHRHGPAGFDNRGGRFIVMRMHPMRLKALRVFAAAAGLFFAAGCETTSSEAVPTQVSMEPARVYAAQPVYVAQVPAQPAPAPVAAAQDTASAPAPAPGTAAAAVPPQAALTAGPAPTANAAPEALAGEPLEDGDEVFDATTTPDATPVITQEIPPATPANIKMSEAVEKVVKLAQSGVDETVMMAYVEKSTVRFDLDADEILYLSDVGVPSGVISAMLKHDGDDPAKALTAVTNSEAAQPAIPAQTAPPPGLAQAQPYTGQPPIEVTTNYVPNAAAPQQVVVQGQPQQVIVQQPAPTVVVAQPESVQYFYSSLSPYGSWYYVTDYGWCWQPTVAVADPFWRPYGPRGHWLWTDAGWYWHSDYSWGWAPFHYGRWHHGGARGWLWIPDRTWGPAWVTWRSSGDYCGWAPLPPAAYYRPGVGFFYHGRSVGLGFSFGLGYDAFCFTPRDRFHDRFVYRHFVPRHEVHHVWGRSRADNHYEFRRGGDRDHHFVNRGFAGSVRQNERPAAIRDNPGPGRGGDGRGNRERVERRGGETVVYRPTPPPRGGASGLANNGGRGADNNGRGPGRGNEGRGNGNNNGPGGERGPRDGGNGGRPGGSGNGGGGRANLDPASPPASAETGVTRPGTGVQPRPGQVPATTTRALEPSQGRGQYTVRNTPSTPAPAPTPTQPQSPPSTEGTRPNNNDRGRDGGRNGQSGYQPNAPGNQQNAPRSQPNVNTRPQNPQVVTSPSAVTGTAATAGAPRIVDRSTRSVSPAPQPQVQTQPQPQRQTVSQPATPAPRITTSTSPYTPANSTPTRGNVESSMRAPVGNPQPQYSRQAVSAPQVQQPQQAPQVRGAMPQRSAPAPQVSQPSGGRGNPGGGNPGGNQGGDNRGRGRGRE
jgi:hypothetical protein